MAGVRRQQQSVGDVFTGNLQSGAIVGAGAYVAGYVLTFVFAVIDGVEAIGDIPTWKLVGWAFYGAHNVQMTATGRGPQGQAQTESGGVLGSSGGIESMGPELNSTIPELIYMLVRVVVLVGAGYVAYQQVDTRNLATDRVAALGGSVVAGYLALAVLGRFLFQSTTSFFNIEITLAPDLATSVLLMGLIYPLVLGAAGAVLAKKRAESQTAGRPGV